MNFTDDGFALISRVLDDAAIAALLQTLAPLEAGAAGARNLLDVPAVRELARSASIRDLMTPILGANCCAVRGLFFDKTPDANWKVPYHQDLSIAVREQIEVADFGPWSVKAGVIHVQPPAEWLEKMVTLRLHLDDCNQTNGALRVLAGTHQGGKLNAAQIAAQRASRSETICELPRGGALLMRPLLLHASSPAQTPSHRRVLHLEWAAQRLPDGLQWHDCVN